MCLVSYREDPAVSLMHLRVAITKTITNDFDLCLCVMQEGGVLLGVCQASTLTVVRLTHGPAGRIAGTLPKC